MSATTALPEGAARPDQSAAPLRIVFVFMTLFARLRLFGSVIEGLLDRGHSVHVLIEDDSEHGEVEQEWLRQMEGSPGFSWEVRRALRSDRWYWPAVSPPAGVGVRPLAPARVRGEAVVQGACPAPRAGLGEDAAQAGVHAKAALDRGGRVGAASARAGDAGRHGTSARPWRSSALTCCSSAPTSVDRVALARLPDDRAGARHPGRRLHRQLGQPDVEADPRHGARRGLRLERDPAREARDIHGIPTERVVVTGAQCFDQWFEWTPRPREEFCPRVGLDPERPYLLYVAGSLAHTAPPEVDLVNEWLAPPALDAARVAAGGRGARPAAPEALRAVARARLRPTTAWSCGRSRP